jgi:hypothetical protein
MIEPQGRSLVRQGRSPLSDSTKATSIPDGPTYQSDGWLPANTSTVLVYNSQTRAIC